MIFHWTKETITDMVERTLEGERAATIAQRLGCIERTVRDMQLELKLVERQQRRRWTAAERKLVRKLYPDTSTVKIAERLNSTVELIYRLAARMGLSKSAAYLASAEACRWRREQTPAQIAHRFKPGQTPANKGVKRPGWSVGRMRETQFKPGERSGFAETNWKPVGTIVADPEGFLRIKVRDRVNGLPMGWHKSIWPLVHWREWEKYHGPIPAGHKVVFKDGDRANCAIENLELISNAEMMRRNTIHKLPKELVDTIMLLGAVKRKVRENAEKYNERSAQPSV
jgi:hypothetical protein